MTIEAQQPSTIPHEFYIDDLISQSKHERPPLTPEMIEALDDLDSFTDYPTGDGVELVGVLSGVKPVALIAKPPDAHESQKLDRILDRLALAKEYTDQEGIIVSYHRELVETMKEVLPRLSVDSGFDPDDHALAGRLFGYPETSTQYFIQRIRRFIDTGEYMPTAAEAESQSSDMMRRFGRIVFSPDHANLELRQYSEPLRKATELMTPMLYRRRIDEKLRR